MPDGSVGALAAVGIALSLVWSVVLVLTLIGGRRLLRRYDSDAMRSRASAEEEAATRMPPPADSDSGAAIGPVAGVRGRRAVLRSWSVFTVRRQPHRPPRV